jgi:hypothetical protein
VSSLNTDWLLTTRADYNISAGDRVYVRLNTDQSLAIHPDPINAAFNGYYNQPSYTG